MFSIKNIWPTLQFTAVVFIGQVIYSPIWRGPNAVTLLESVVCACIAFLCSLAFSSFKVSAPFSSKRIPPYVVITITAATIIIVHQWYEWTILLWLPIIVLHGFLGNKLKKELLIGIVLSTVFIRFIQSDQLKTTSTSVNNQQQDTQEYDIISGLSGHECIIMISVDTLRFDTFQAYFNQPSLPAGWFAFSMVASNWTEARSHSTWTLPSLASLQTGQAPHIHGAGQFIDGTPHKVTPISDDVSTLAEELQKEGYATLAITANPYVRKDIKIGRGFQHFENRTETQTLFHGVHDSIFSHYLLYPFAKPFSAKGKDMIESAIEQLEDIQGTNFYFWLHLLDAHAPYTSQDKHHPDRWTCPTPGAVDCFHPTIMNRSNNQYDDQQIRSLYTETAHRTLDELDALWTYMASSGLMQQCTTVFTSDHGEELGERHLFGHGFEFSEPQIHIPLLISIPNQIPQMQSSPVFLSDIKDMLYAIRTHQEWKPITEPRPLVGTIKEPHLVGLWTPNSYSFLNESNETWERIHGDNNHQPADNHTRNTLMDLKQKLKSIDQSKSFLIELGYLSQ